MDPVWAQKIARSVASSYQNRRNTEERARAQNQLKAWDSEIENQEAHVKEKRKILDEMVRTVGKAFIEGEERESASSNTESNDPSTKRELAQYREVTREYESALDLLHELKLKQSTERVALRAPQSAPLRPVTILEEPRVSREPVSPKIGLNLVIGIVGGGLGGAILAVLMLLFFGVVSMVGSQNQNGAEDS